MNIIKRFLPMAAFALFASGANAQATAGEVLSTARLANDYFMAKYEDPTVPTNWKRVRPSSLWTRAVYYEGLMALQRIDPQQRYLDYTTTWADFHQWTPRNGTQTCDADDQCCGQTYMELLFDSLFHGKPLAVSGQKAAGESGTIEYLRENLDHQMQTVNPKNGSLYGWWTWIDAIQMAMPLYVQMYKATGERRYLDHAMKMYRWSRNECGGGLFNVKEGLWWRDADYVPPYKEPDGQQCYWSRGNGWVYAALVRCMDLLPENSREYKELKRDYMLMSEGLLRCQREDGFWQPSLVSSNYAMPETSGTSLFLYGFAWGMQKGYLDTGRYRPAADRAWQAMLSKAVHPDGFLGWMQGTGKDPSAGQPLSYTRIPDFEDYGTGCFLLGATEYYKMLVGESKGRK